LIKYITVIFILVPLVLFSEGVYSVITSKMPQSAYVGAYFVDVDSGKVVVQYNESNLFVPASLTKIMSTLVAWEVLGPEFTYTTTIYVPRGNISPTLKGNVVIKGNGDPSMSVDILKENLKRFVLDGVKEIDGNIVIDNSFFSNERWGIGWEWDYKNPSIDALILKENTNTFSPYDANAVAINFGNNFKKVLNDYGIRVTGNVAVGKVSSSYREYIVMKSVPLKNLHKRRKQVQQQFIRRADFTNSWTQSLWIW